MQALFLEKIETGRPKQADHFALRWMSEEHYRDLARRGFAFVRMEEPPSRKQLRSNRQLAERAAKRVLFDQVNAVDRLRKEFEERKDYWLEVAKTHDDVPESLEAKALDRIAEIAKRHGMMMFPGIRD